MILTLALIVSLLAIGTWIATMYLWWKKEEGIEEVAVNLALFPAYAQKHARIARRTWYRISMHAKTLIAWLNRKAGTVFFVVFPKAAPAFAKRDELAGLTQGPSSYFLLSISETQKEQAKRTRRKIF